MKTSIVILNWNTLDLLKDCVESIKENTKDYELIIIDNGSIEDETTEYINSVADKYIINEKNLGFSAANNQGAKLAEGEYVCFLNNDIVVGENWLEDMFDIFKTKQNVGAVGPLGNPQSSIVNGEMFFYNQYKGQYEKDIKVSRLIGFCILMERTLFENIGCWCEDFGTGNYEDDYLSELIKREDKELWISVKSDVNHLTPGRTFETNNLNYIDTLQSNKKIFDKKMEELNGRI